MAVPDLQYHDDMASLMTASGARIETLSPCLAQAFLDRYGLAGHRPTTLDLAWGAFEEVGPLIGVGLFAKTTATRGRTWIAVAPERRRLGIGTELAGLVANAARSQGLQYLTCRYLLGEAAPHRLARSLGMPLARRVKEDGTWTVIVLSREQTER